MVLPDERPRNVRTPTPGNLSAYDIFLRYMHTLPPSICAYDILIRYLPTPYAYMPMLCTNTICRHDLPTRALRDFRSAAYRPMRCLCDVRGQESDIVKGLTSGNPAPYELWCYAFSTRCPVLTWGMFVPGCNDYLTKPYGAMELKARIDVQLRLKYLWHLEIHRLLCERTAILQLPPQVQFEGTQETVAPRPHHRQCAWLWRVPNSGGAGT
eukprot:3383922-Rhodomonas_salina.1